MTNTVSIVGSTQSTAPPSVPAAAATASAATANAVDSKPLTQSNETPISPRIVVDPLAGAITEFLNASGQIQSQIPSAAVVAYLRAGLGTDGQVKQTPGQDQPAKQEGTVVA